MTNTIVPKSDQLNADDLIARPVTVTIQEVRKGSVEQPVDVILVEYPGRAYRPSKSMRRVMVKAWGPNASTYTGRRLTLVCNPDITFGRERVGGIEIAAISHIEGPLTIPLTATRGKRRSFTVQPLDDRRDWLGELEQVGDDLAAVAALGSAAAAAQVDTATLARIRARYSELKPTSER